ncbi:acetyltransferase [Belnapia sp. T6]|uniref:Acetyltransferase n=2 Tax=Belnapia mucosa TaxID=2804532 RepID=A0ABS1V4I1_9PROT|nr:acetyltransferase [Belnapia mucosa]
MARCRPIVLKDDVWLCARVIVLAGVTVGEGTVVGAGSVVTHDLPPHVLAAGNPAQVVQSLGAVNDP